MPLEGLLGVQAAASIQHGVEAQNRLWAETFIKLELPADWAKWSSLFLRNVGV